MKLDYLVPEYAEKIKPLLPLAKKAFGSRDQDTPQHAASREYTRLAAEFKEKGGSLADLADALGVTYSGIRRRVAMKDVSVSEIKRRPRKRSTTSEEDLSASVERVRAAKAIGSTEYHDQLVVEYENGISLDNLAKALGVSSGAPLYYGVQRSLQRRKTTTE